jgi:hypothetical protein
LGVAANAMLIIAGWPKAYMGVVAAGYLNSCKPVIIKENLFHKTEFTIQ